MSNLIANTVERKNIITLFFLNKHFQYFTYISKTVKYFLKLFVEAHFISYKNIYNYR